MLVKSAVGGAIGSAKFVSPNVRNTVIVEPVVFDTLTLAEVVSAWAEVPGEFELTSSVPNVSPVAALIVLSCAAVAVAKPPLDPELSKVV